MKDQMQNKLMRFDPAFGTERPYPSHAQQWREWHGRVAWLFNPWTGNRRHPADIGSDTFGHLICTESDQMLNRISQDAGGQPAPIVRVEGMGNGHSLG